MGPATHKRQYDVIHKHNLNNVQQVRGRVTKPKSGLASMPTLLQAKPCLRYRHRSDRATSDQNSLVARQTPVWVHAQVHIVLGFVPGCVSLLPGGPGPSDEVHIAAVVLRMALGVLQAEGVLGGSQDMLLKLAQHVLLFPDSGPLVCASLTEGLDHRLHSQWACWHLYCCVCIHSAMLCIDAQQSRCPQQCYMLPQKLYTSAPLAPNAQRQAGRLPYQQ